MSRVSVKKAQQQYQSVLQKLEGKLLALQSRRENLDTRAFVVVEEGEPSVHRASTALDDQPELYHGEIGSLVSTATDIIINALQIKLAYVRDMLESLSPLVKENPRQATPAELSFSRYEEWLESNQQLFEFNSQLYELENVKFDLKRKQQRVLNVPGNIAVERSTVASQLVHSSINQAQSLLTRFHRQSDSSNTTRVYIHELLNPRGDKTTLESQKVQGYIAECFQFADADPNEVKGAHSESYQKFMGVLCSYIVEKQREWQREEISYELVYSAVEHYVMPQLKPLVLPRVAQLDRDNIISEKCRAYSNVTLDQLRVRPHLQSGEPVPFIEAITQLRASYFSSTPTDKMYSVVAAAKALYDRLGELGETSIDGDAFLDLWIYVIIKANVKDLATNLSFMIDYGNPQLSSGEAGYYLTTLEAAVQFITTLTPLTLKAPSGGLEFVVCERAHFNSLCSLGSGMELVEREVEIQGYRVAVLQDWALNRARLFRSALVPTANYLDTAKVSVIRVNQDNTNPAIVQYLLKQLRAEGMDAQGLFSKTIPVGTAVFVNMTSIDHQNVILLPTGDYDLHISSITHIIQLQRLGSLTTDHSFEDSCLIQPPSSTSDVPLSPPYSNIMQAGGKFNRVWGSTSEQERKPPLWSPYMLSSPKQQFHEVSFTNPLAVASSFKSEHRQLEQARHTPDSLATKQSGSSQMQLSHSWRSNDSNFAAQSRDGAHDPATFTVEVEVHEEINVASQPKPNLQDQSAHVETLQTCQNTKNNADKEEGWCTLNLSANSSKKCTEPAGMVIENPGTSERETDSQNSEASNGGEVSSTIRQDSNSTSTVPTEDILSPQYRTTLEEAFVTNHLYGTWPQSVVEAMHSIILQAQMYLQRLNYLSVSYKLSGVYDDITLQAVRTFQIAHNHHEAEYSMSVPEDGQLTSPTFQYLRQAFLTIYASMLRLGLDKHLGETFDPMSTSPRDVAIFRECVSKLQRKHGLKECQEGAVCANTIQKVKQLLKSQKS